MSKQIKQGYPSSSSLITTYITTIIIIMERNAKPEDIVFKERLHASEYSEIFLVDYNQKTML